jgi:putative ABC transport system permease protein
MLTLWQDVRYGLRVLAKNPGFAMAAILTLALGIGATTSIFSVVYAALLQPLPFPDPNRIVRVWEVSDEGYHNNFSDPNFEDLRDANRSFEAFAQYGSYTTTVTGGREAMRVDEAPVSKQFLGAMGIQPVVGRGFLPEEMQFGGSPVVLVSYAFWRGSLGGDADLSKKHLTFDGKDYAVVGVLPPGFRFPEETDLWIPREQLDRYPSRTAHNWRAIGRLKPGVELGQVRADLSDIARNLKQKLGSDTGMADAAILTLQEALVGNMRTALFFLLGAAGILLLAACANTANLLLARAASRQREFAVRVALGASRRRLISQFIAESFVLALGGAILGVFLAYWGVAALLRLAPSYLPSTVDVRVNVPVLGFCLLLSLMTACGLGLALALRAMRVNLNGDLKEGQQRSSGSTKEMRVRAVLMAAQVAVATVLLTGAGLLTRSLLGLVQTPPGFRTSNILTMQMFPAEDQTEAMKARRRQELDQILQRMREIPGVDNAGLTSGLPLTDSISNGTFLLVENQQEIKSLDDFERIAKIPERTGFAFYQVASSGYFSTMQIPLLRGRMFHERDGAEAPHVALISQSLARERWPGQDPIGHHIEFGNMDGDVRLLQIIGVVGDVHGRGLDIPVEPIIYVHSRQRVPREFAIVIHTTSSALSIATPARNMLREIDPDLAPKFQMFPEIVSKSLGDREFQLCLILAFAAGSLALAILGLYGVTSYLVSERTKEIGIRIAVGAQPLDVVKLILGQSGRVVLIGIAVGVCASLAIGGILRGLLFAIAPNDPATIAGVCALLAVLALFACWLPARRATQVDPISALRNE